MESTDGPPINKSIGLFYNLLSYNNQRVNSSNEVFDSGGMNQLNETARTSHNSELSGLRLIAMVCPITVIFVLAVTGNLLVIATIAINRRMRTAFNAFLLNLAVADLLLGIFCMPFTLSGFIMKQFIFGAVMCKLIPYLQAVSVTYYAICQPLKSKSYRQSSAHVYKVIGGVWLLAFIILSPIAYLSELQPTQEVGKYKCRENWSSTNNTIMFTIFLDIILFVIPLFIMIISYFLIAKQFLSLGKQTVMHLSENDGQASYQATATRQSSIDATYADGDTFLEGTQSQTNYSLNFQERSDSTIRDNTSPAMSNKSPSRLEPINGRNSGNQTNQSKIRHRSTSPNSHELLSAKSSINKPKTISFSSSLENISLDEKEIALQNDQPNTPSPSIFTGTDEHSPVFKTLSVNSAIKGLENKNLEMHCRKHGRSPIGSERTGRQQINFSFSLRKKDKNNNQERIRKPSSSTISSGQHGSSSNDNSLFISNADQQQNNIKIDSYCDKSVPALSASTTSKDQTAMKLRSSVDRRSAQKRQSRVIKMLVILVLEFFICWTPLHCINLISLYKPKIVYEAIGYNGLTMFLVLAYSSSCTNSITYCFMNSKFRQSFFTVFACCRGEERTKSNKFLKPKIRSTTIEEL